ncbi:hypothetical protein FRC01_006340 [Tulasnella sp. 417]|nr:hypothetical protein FRC01_006340 [Tulasnella sp. 417]
MDFRLLHPTEPVSLIQWLEAHDELVGSTDNDAEKARLSTFFALTSRNPTEPTLYDINLHLNSFTLQSRDVQDEAGVTRDYDSLIGVFPARLPLLADLSIYTIPRPKGRLEKNLSVYVDLPDLDLVQVPLHKIPNWELGTVATKFSVNVMFPSLYHPGSSEKLTEDHYRIFYDRALRPAARRHCNANDSYWPASYQSETIRAQHQRGAFTHTAHVVNRNKVAAFLDAVRDNCAQDVGLIWAVGMLWVVDGKGLKEQYRHTPSPSNATRTLNRLLRIFDVAEINRDRGDQLYIDVAVEITQPDHILLWKTHSHDAIIRTMLKVQDVQYYRTAQRYSQDTVALLQHAAGFRVSCGPQAPQPYLRKLNVYTTDKAHTALIDNGHHAKYIDPIKALTVPTGDGDSEPKAFAAKMRTVYSAAENEQVPGNARLEGRVNFTEAATFLVDFELDDFFLALLSIPCETWWPFKTVRLQAALRVLESHLSASATVRAARNSLALAGVCVWMANAMNARPSDKAAENALREACLPQVQDYDLNWVPTTQGGMFVIHHLAETYNVFQLPLNNNLPEGNTVARALGFPSWGDLIVHITKPRPRNREVLATEAFRRNNRSGVRAPSPETVEDNVDGPSGSSNPAGPVIPFNVDDYQGTFEHGREDTTFTEYAYSLVVRILREVVSRAPNHRTDGAYLVSSINPSTIEPTFFKGSLVQRLPEYFRQFRLVRPDEDNWDAVFNRIFPDKGAAPLVNGWKDLRSRNEWVALTVILTEGQVRSIRAELKKEFDRFSWVPFSQNDKVWKVSSGGRLFRGHTLGPWILPNKKADWESVPTFAED